MKKIFFSTALLAITFLCTSCASGKKDVRSAEPVKLQAFSAESEKSGFEAAERFAAGFSAAVRSGNFAEWQKAMPPHIQSRVNAASFDKMRKELQELFGTMTGSRYLGTLRKGDLRDHLWTVSFEKNGRINEVVYLVRVFCAENNLPEISGFGIRRF